MINREQINTLLNLQTPSASEVIIYSVESSKRLNYTCRFIFNYVLKCKYSVSTNKQEFLASNAIKINYSQEVLSDAFTVKPHNLLFEKGLSSAKPDVKGTGADLKMFLNRDGQLDFDLFSMVFYFISRLEEWLDFDKDAHERFELKESFLYKQNSHLFPVIDCRISEFKEELLKYFPDAKLQTWPAKTIATIDVDNLFAYANKGFVRTVGATAKDFLKGNFGNIRRRNAVNQGKIKDPFDIYEAFTGFCKQHNIPLIYFFLFSSGNKFDRTVNPSSESFTTVFETIRKLGGLIGIHPGYYTSTSNELALQADNFNRKLGQKTTFSRQHFLRFDIKVTPKLLMKAGILVDFSMGFASGPGFRAGTAYPFNYYDFENEQEEPLLFVPFCAMDGVYFVYNRQSPDEALKSLKTLKSRVSQTGGLFVTVFHERTFANHLYPGFGNMYQELLST